MEEPREYQSIKRILNSMVPKYKEDVPSLLHEFFDRYMTEIISGAKIHAERRNDVITEEDVELSISARTQFSFQTGPTLDDLKQQALIVNKEKKLPNLSDKNALLLPQEDYCLLAPNYQLLRRNNMDLDI